MSLSICTRQPAEAENYGAFYRAFTQVPECMASVVRALLELSKALLTLLCETVRVISVAAIDLCGSREGASFAVGFGLGCSCSFIRYWFLTRGPLALLWPEPRARNHQL